MSIKQTFVDKDGSMLLSEAYHKKNCYRSGSLYVKVNVIKATTIGQPLVSISK